MSGGDDGSKSGDGNGPKDDGPKSVDARVARRRQDPIGRRLRQMYDDVVSEDIPDDFLGFLEQADDRLSGHAGPAKEGERVELAVPESKS